ncbi:penicillin-binding protein 1A [Massilia sp. Leaf139]|uniref:penicillin-binding protein 1A n=1 Tax=Massilia sp. Leaf139 TaxID=1736272 RepID=UPI0006FB372F|nr:transglycosylase domain-containing protein [Massilia sp. Leaf139]KQQ97365.1 penicillin-binding protein [Massilia sp. Leaf139]
MDQDEKTETGIRQQARDLFGSAGGRARAGVRQAHGFLSGRPRHQQVLIVGMLSAAALMLALAAYLIVLIPLTPGIDDLKQVSSARPSRIISSDGKELGTFEQGLQERIKLSQVSPHVVKALISTEDHRFYEHHGVDFTRIAGALLASLKGDAQGGSTITQQLARNMFPDEIGRARSINRKLKELITAIKIENTYSKTEILEAYLNTVPFLYNARGIEMAARTYFGKPALKLDVLEAATLVGMLKGTYYYNPVTNPERSLARRNVVLGQMAKHGAFDEKRLAALKKRPLRLDFERLAERSGRDNHFTAHVRKWLLEWADENDYDLALDGLIVQTTLDAELQEAALRAVEKQASALQAVADVEWANPGLPGSSSIGTYTAMRSSVAPFDYYWHTHRAQLDAFVRESGEYRKAVEGGEAPAAALKRIKGDRAFMKRLKEAKARLEAGFVAVDPTTGEVKAWVGSRDFARDQFDHVAQATRQPGSTFKPFVYGAALENGIPPEQPYVDAVMDIRAADGTVWRPTDMSGTTGRQMTMRDGLVFSKNTITAQVMRDVGLPPVVKLAQNLGVRQSKLSAVPSLALGTSPVTLLEMVSSYATIAAQGEYRKPVFVRRISDREGNVIADFANVRPERAMSQAASATLIDMLRGVVNRGTGTGVRYRFGINGDVAGKTGTTQNNADGWFILMHPNLVAGAWVGFNDNRVTMRSSYWGQGGHNAILLVGDFFKSALDTGKIDRAALFPGGRPPAPPRAREEEEPEEEFIEPGDIIEGMPAEEPQEVEPPEDEAEEVIDAPMEGVPPPPPQPVPTPMY